VRSFLDKPIPPDVVRKIVEAAHLTASSRNGQPWHFIVVEDHSTLKQLGQLVKTGPYIAQAAMAIVVVLEKSEYAVSDGSRAIQSMILTAWAAGVGSNWAGFMNLDSIKPLLHIPAEMDVLAVVPFGYPDKTIGQGKKNRKPLSEVAHRESFDQPLE
jgi:nitroreductase